MINAHDEMVLHRNRWRLRRRLWIGGAILILLLALVVGDLVAAVWLPTLYADSVHAVSTADRLKAEGDARSAILSLLTPIVAFVVGAAGLLNFQETRNQNQRTSAAMQRQLKIAGDQLEQGRKQSEEQLELQRRGQVTDRFSKAIEQLGDGDLDIRIGAVFALEQIAKDSEELHWPIMEVLTAFLRHHAEDPPKESEAVEGLRFDFQAIATVVGRRNVNYDVRGLRLDMHGVALCGVNLANAQLQRVGFRGSRLRRALFRDSQLQKAHFRDADLQEADFRGAQLQGAIFDGANLRQTQFTGVDLSQTRGLSQEQLDVAVYDRSTKPHPGLTIKRRTDDEET